jgi:hypothetical protein
MPQLSAPSWDSKSSSVRREPESILEYLDAHPGQTLADYILRETEKTRTSPRQLRKEFWAYRAHPVHGPRFRFLFDHQHEETSGLDLPASLSGSKATWIEIFYKTRTNSDACQVADVSMAQVNRWLDPDHKDYDPDFASAHQDAMARVVAVLQDDLERARRMAIEMGDAKTLSSIALQHLRALKPEVYGNKQRVSFEVNPNRQLPAGGQAQLAERAGRLLEPEDGDVIDAEAEVVS